MNVGSLFSGIGGFDYGLERAGMRVVWQCEADEFCQRALAYRWPDVPCYPDVRELRGADVEPVDVLCGGFPCQDISLAGKGAGIDGARSGLWAEYARLIGELRPRYVVVENVAALLTRGLGRVLGDLDALGYDAEWDCIPASAVGAPHQRDRVWLVAYPKSVGGEDRTGCAPSEALGGTVAGAGGRVVDGDSSEGVRLVGAGASGSDGCGAALADSKRRGRQGRPQDTGRGSDLGPTQERREGAGEPAGCCTQGGAAADAHGGRREPRQPDLQARESDAEGSGAGPGEVADAYGETRASPRSPAEAVLGSGEVERSGRRGGVGGDVQDADERALQPWRVGGRAAQAGGSEWWAVEPPVGRVAHGVPDRLAQLAAYGNALVPQIAEWLGRRILEYEGRAA